MAAPIVEIPSTVLRPKKVVMSAHHPEKGTIFASSVDHMREQLLQEHGIECTRWRITALLNEHCRRHKGGKLKNDPKSIDDWSIQRLNSTIATRRQAESSPDQQKSEHE